MIVRGRDKTDDLLGGQALTLVRPYPSVVRSAPDLHSGMPLLHTAKVTSGSKTSHKPLKHCLDITR